MSQRGWDRAEASRRFHQAMVDGYERLKEEIGYPATRFKQMVDANGGEGAAHTLLQPPAHATSEGFTRFWEEGRLELSVECFALLPEYAPLFTEDELAIARERLLVHGMDVDAALDRHASDPSYP